MTEEEMISLLQSYDDIKTSLDIIKEQEMKYRKKICAELLAKRSKFKGSIGPYKVSATAKSNVTWDNIALDNMYEDLSTEEKQCIKYVPKVDGHALNALKKIMPDTIIEEAKTVKPGAPELKLESY